MTPEELKDTLTERLGDHVLAADIAWDHLTVTLDAEGYAEAAALVRDDERLACDFFECTIGVDERDEGFAVIANLYSTTHHHRVLLRHVCAGGREAPVAPSLTHLYRGADWGERETYDMFGIEFEGHPSLLPRILTVENFEGWPLRKDFPLATREAKPWPGAKEPVEVGDEGEREAAIVSTTTSASVKGDEEEAARETAEQKAERAREKAAEARRRKAEERAAEGPAGGDQAATDEEAPQQAPPAAAEETAEETPAPEVSAASDPRVATPDDRAGGGQDLGGARDRAATSDEAGEREDTSWHARRTPDQPTGEQRDSPPAETDAERTERAVEESDEAHPEGLGTYDQTSVPGERTAGAGDAGDEGGAYPGGPPAPPQAPADAHEEGTTPAGDAAATGTGRDDPPPPADEPRPGRSAGEPPTTQSPGESPLDGGLHEDADRRADEAGDLTGGERPSSTERPDVERPSDEGPTISDIASPGSEEPLGPSGPTDPLETGGPGTVEDVTESAPATDAATRDLPDSPAEALEGDDADTGVSPREKAEREAGPGGTSQDIEPEAEVRHETPEQSEATETDEE